MNDVHALDAVEVPLDGTQLIEASAGTGKTWTIAFLFLRLIVERGVPVEEILVVTFTRAATAELSGRLRQRLRQALGVLDSLMVHPDGPQRRARAASAGGIESSDPLLRWLDGLPDPMTARERVAEALHGMDGAAISTIHGFCARMLQEFAFESGARLDVEVLDDERAMVRLAVEDFWAVAADKAPAQLVRHLIATRQGPDALVGLATQALADPTVPVLPDLHELVDMDEVLRAVDRWKQAHEAARAAWFAGRDEVKALLKGACNRSDLHGNVYSYGKVASWTYRCDALFERASTGPAALFDGFDKLTTPVIAARTKKGRRPPQHPFFDAAHTLWEAYRATRGPVNAWVARFQREMVYDVRARVAMAKERARAVSFQDLLHRLDASLHGEFGDALAARIHERYPAVLIDEFQDTDPVQYRIFDRIHQSDGQGVLFLIGDPKQAIYGFRGADVQAYLSARSATDARWTMTTNYRTDPRLLQGIAHLYRGHDAPFVDPSIAFVFGVTHREGAVDRLRRVVEVSTEGEPDRRVLRRVAPLHLVYVNATGKSQATTGEIKGFWVHQTYPDRIADEVVRMLRDDLMLLDPEKKAAPISPGDIAILVRSNAQARKLHGALTKRGVPAALQGDASVLDTDEAAEVEALARAMADPGDPAAVRAALATRCVGVNAHELMGLAEDEEAWERWVDAFQRWSHAWLDGGFLLALRQLVADLDVPERLLSEAGGERAMTNVLHLGELLQRMATERRLHRAGLVAWLASARADPRAARSELGQDADPIRLESDAGAVKLVTVHRAKGLEYPIVMLPFLGEGLRDPSGIVRFHDEEGHTTLDMGSHDYDAHAARAAEEELAESTRLLYVALTRAKHHLVVFWGGFPRHGSSPLGWLFHGANLAGASPLGAVHACCEHLEGLSDAQRKEHIKALAESSGGAVYARELSENPEGRWTPPVDEPPTLTAYTPTREGFTPWRVGSFSALVSGGVGDGHDVDGVVTRAGASGGPPVPLASWPRGAAPGTVLHGVLEVLDFQAPDAERRASVQSALVRHGGPEAWADPLTDALHEAAQVPFGEGEPGLASLAMVDRLDELGFVFPVGQLQQALTPSRLAACFDAHATRPVVRGYALRVASMGFVPLCGFLKGYIDVVYRHQGRFGVIDYKSNHLGDGLHDYRAEALDEVMAHHDYILQYHLYVLALHRYLRSRLPSYRYDVHVMGARYLFLRGMVPAAGAGAGVYADCPPWPLIEALDACLEGAQ